MRSLAWLLLPLVLSAQDQVPVFGTTVVISGGLKGDIYLVPHNTRSVRALDHLTPEGSIYTTSLNVPPQSFSFGFPGITGRFEWFGIDYSGRFWIEKPGIYRFRLISDDGAMLYIDGQLICDNDGLHGPEVRLGSVRLEGGMHAIRVPYFQGPREAVALMLEVAGPGEAPRIFSTEEFKPPANPEEWHFPANPPGGATDPDLPRVQPPYIAKPEGSNGGKHKKKKPADK